MTRRPRDDPEQVVIDFEEAARRQRDAAIERAVDHADRVEPGWSERAYAYLLRYAAVWDQFTAEDVRDAAETMAAIPRPPDRRAWGGIFARARRAGVIEPAGFAVAKDPAVHCNNIRLWRTIR